MNFTAVVATLIAAVADRAGWVHLSGTPASVTVTVVYECMSYIYTYTSRKLLSQSRERQCCARLCRSFHYTTIMRILIVL